MDWKFSKLFRRHPESIKPSRENIGTIISKSFHHHQPLDWCIHEGARAAIKANKEGKLGYTVDDLKQMVTDAARNRDALSFTDKSAKERHDWTPCS